MNLANVDAALGDHGLTVLGGFHVATDDAVPDVVASSPARTLLIAGNAGSSLWPMFTASAEYADGLPDPLDRWSVRVGETVAAGFGARALYPFGGPPWHPFQRWAQRCGRMHASPILILMHHRHGLWHAFRFALALPVALELPGIPADIPACDRCSDRPCLHTCPVGAFDSGGYDVGACRGYLAANPEAACHRLGCLARRACPVAPENRYRPEHAAFHMAAFTGRGHPSEEDRS